MSAPDTRHLEPGTWKKPWASPLRVLERRIEDLQRDLRDLECKMASRRDAAFDADVVARVAAVERAVEELKAEPQRDAEQRG